MDPEFNAGLVPLFRRELELCAVRPGEQVGVITRNRERQGYADAFVTAATELGAKAFHVDLSTPRHAPPGEMGGAVSVNPLDYNELVAETLARCDLVIDLVFLLWSERQRGILASGARMICCVDPVDVLERLFPSQQIKRRVLADAELLKAASVLRITSEVGTDVTYEIGQYRVNSQYGFADEPGHWDLFATALVATYGNDDAVNGQIVVKPGDVVMPFKHYVTSAMTFRIERGRIAAIEGAHDAAMLRDYLRWFDDERAYTLSHAGWSQHPGGRWEVHQLGTGGIGSDARSVAGGVMFSTGPNVEGGGDNDTLAHLDIAMRDCTLLLDDKPIVERGRLLDADVAPATSATPF